ncbi:MAG: threonine--tRNA ligase [Candidatus Nanoarchaeia archaeon]|nr:threonine--tRNA ligase [Candidatus Nanoarchaeia archaeon]
MKILLIHADYIKYEAKKKAIKTAEEVKDLSHELKDCLVVFTAVEFNDEVNPKKASEQLVKQIKDVAQQVKSDKVVIYPYAHLSSNLSKPDVAVEVMKTAENMLKKDFKEVLRAPFGWYKAFEIKCKGHPLSELSREFDIEGNKPSKNVKIQAIKAEEDEKFDYKQLLKEISKFRLDREELKSNDHRILGQKLDLWSFNEVAPGMVFWHNNGLIIRNELINYWREEHRKSGYEEISTPQVMDSKLWKISGHWEKYKDNNFITDYEGRKLLVKPMNCPGGMLVYKQKPKSYKDLPLRVGELGTVHRVELSGVLAGLFRVIQFTQDDAHIFCEEKDLEKEIIKIIELIKTFYKKFAVKFDHVELSTRPEKRIGSDKIWDKAEKTLESVLKKNKIKYKINKGDGAFYGPKIDFHIKDSLDRTWQCSTIQLDFAMPERFDLNYVDSKGKEKRLVMLHRVIYGSLERFMGVLTEHLNGNFPTWLSPVQVRVISFTDRNAKSVDKFTKELLDAGVRADSDTKSNTVQYKVREAEELKIPYIVVIGDKEEENKTIAVRTRGKNKVDFGIKKDDFIEKLLKDIKERSFTP